MTKQELYELRDLAAQIKRVRERIAAAKESADGLSARLLDGMPRGGKNPDKILTALARAEMWEEELERTENALTARLIKALRAFQKLPSQQRDIMTLRYIDGKSWVAVSRISHYSLSHCHLIHDTALKNLQKKGSR